MWLDLEDAELVLKGLERRLICYLCKSAVCIILNLSSKLFAFVY